MVLINIIGPSQIRYVCYYDYMLDHIIIPHEPVTLHTIKLSVGIDMMI